MSTLLKSAIADAKAIRQTALENARVSITESFTPKLQSMLEKKIKEDCSADGEYGDGKDLEPVGQNSNPKASMKSKGKIGSISEKKIKETYGAVNPDTGDYKPGSVNIAEVEGEEDPFATEDPNALDPNDDPNAAPQVDPNAVELDVDATPGQEVDVVPTGVGQVELEPALDPNAMGAPEVPGAEDGTEVNPGDLDLESIIAELEAEAGEEVSPEEPTFGAEAGAETDPSVNVTAKGPETPGDAGEPEVSFSDETGAEGTEDVPSAAGDDEEVDLEEILRELESGETLDETLTTDQSLSSHTEQPQKGNFGSDKTGTNGTPSKGGTEPAIEKAAADTKYGKVGKSAGDNFEDFGKATKTLEENKKLRRSLSDHIKAVVFLKSKINEVNLLNAKLLYTNKLFRNFPLTNEQKVKIVESLDLTKSVREVKLVYTTIAESISFGSSRTMKKPVSSHKVITEGLASKAVASTKPTREILSEGDQMATRFQQLAGIKIAVKK